MEFLFTVSLFAICMGIMAIGLLFNRKPIVKDCGLDPVSGERVTDCACAAQGKPQCFKKKVLSLFDDSAESGKSTAETAEDPQKIVSLPRKQ